MNVTRHLSTSEVTLYRAGNGAPEELLTLDDHLATCGACRALVADGLQTEEATAALRATLEGITAAEVDHLSFEKLSGFVEDSLDQVELEMAESHLSVCRECESEVRDLQSFRDATSPQFTKEYGPSVPRPLRSALRPHVLAFFRPRASSRTPGWAMLAAAVLLIAVITAAWFGLKPETYRTPEVAQAPGASPTPTNPQPGISPTVPSIEAKPFIAINDGPGSVTLDDAGNLSGVNALSATQKEAIKSALQKQVAVSSLALKGLGRAGVLLGGGAPGENFNIRGPFGTVVESVQPILRWEALKGASGYKVAVYDLQFNSVAASPLLTTTSWTVAQSLKRGMVYTWHVTAQKEGAEINSPRPPAAEAKFKILDVRTAEELRRVRRANPRSHLALGILYAQAGLLEDAEHELTSLVRANPKSELARKLLDHVRGARKGTK